MELKNQHFFSAAIIVVLYFIAGSCNTNETMHDQATGKLKLNVGLSIVEHDLKGTLKSTAYEDFKVEIFIHDVVEPLLVFDQLSGIPDSLELPVGIYYATAYSVDNPAAAFETPYYLGRSELFIITAGGISEVEMTCSLANIMVSVVYSEQIKNSFASYHTTVSNTSGDLIFASDENRKGFFNSGPLSIESQLHYITGEGGSEIKTLTGEIADPQYGRHYEIRIDASLPEGFSMIRIHMNELVEKEIITLTDEQSSGGEEGDKESIGFGDLLITEIMYNPDALSDSEGEWIEIYNNSGNTVNLKDLVIRRGSKSNFHQIASDVNLASGAYAVLGRTEFATDNIDYVYGKSILLANNGSELIINTFGNDGTDGPVICSVDYGATGFNTRLEGKSIQLDPSIKDAAEAQLGSNWCSSSLKYSTGDFGTPGSVNSPCN